MLPSLTILPLLLSLARFAVAAQTDSLAEVYNKYKSVPESCEAVYYGLFVDQNGNPVSSYSGGDGTNLFDSGVDSFVQLHKKELWPRYSCKNQEQPEKKADENEGKLLDQLIAKVFQDALRKDFQQLKNIHSKLVLQKEIAPYSAPIGAEHKKRLQNIGLQFQQAEIEQRNGSIQVWGGEGIGTAIEPASDGRAVGISRRGVPIHQDAFKKERPEIYVGDLWLLQNQSSMTQAFVIGHELSHLTDFVEDRLASCLARNYGANTVNEKQEKEAAVARKVYGLLKAVPKLKGLAEVTGNDEHVPGLTVWLNSLLTAVYGMESMLGDQKEILMKDVIQAIDEIIDVVQKKIKRAKKNKEGVVIEKRTLKGSRLDPTSFLNPTLEKAVDRLNLAKRMLVRRIEPTTEEFGFAIGKGTEFVQEIKTALDQGELSQARGVFEKVQKYKILPDQVSEAAADLRGIETALAYIEQNPKIYPTSEVKRKAALAVLFSMPPHMYTGEAKTIMDSVGAKKTNEARVFGLLLSNEKFRNLLGCEFKFLPKPVDCLNSGRR